METLGLGNTLSIYLHEHNWSNQKYLEIYLSPECILHSSIGRGQQREVGHIHMYCGWPAFLNW